MAPNANGKYSLKGLVTNQEGQPCEGLTVRAFDSDPITPDDPLGQGTTDAEGRYSIEFSRRAVEWQIGGPDLYIRVYADDRLLGQSPVYKDQKNQININLAVDQGTAEPEPAYTVRGTIRDSWGNALSDVPLMAYDLDLREEQPLGQARSDGQGTYRISYQTRQFRKREKGEADLVVKAFSASGKVVASSPVMFNAPTSTVIDLVISDTAGTPSLFERIDKALAPLRGDLPVTELEEDKEHRDLTFLSGETGFDKNVLARFILAHRLVQQGLPAEFWFAMLNHRVFTYAASQSLAEQLPQVQKDLFNLTASAVRKSLTSSIDQNEIAASFSDKTEKRREEFLRIGSRRSVEEKTFVGQALDH